LDRLTRYWKSSIEFWVWAIVFGLAFTQDPIYAENQNTKFLIGLAHSGLGYLREDWLANTIDPLPVFTWIVQISYKLLGEYGFYLYPFLAFGVYIYSLCGIADCIFKIRRSTAQFLTFLAILIAIHITNIRIFDLIPYLPLHEGLADQYVLGHYFQPSMFGVLILLSIYDTLRNRSTRAVINLAIASTLHPAYLPSQAMLTLAYLITMVQGRMAWRTIVRIGTLSVVLALPVFLYMTLTFAPTTPELWQRSQEIIVNFRIPHHSIPSLWLANPAAWVQIGMMVVATVLVLKTRLAWIMGLPLGLAAIATVVEIVSSNATVAFTAPWRVSAFLMPLALALIVAAAIRPLFRWLSNHRPQLLQPIQFGAITILAITVFLGINTQIAKFQAPDTTLGMMNFVREQAQSGEVYLVPLSASKDDNRMEEMWKFRLYTGVPILVNFKSHPYKDVEVIEWYERVESAVKFYETPPSDRCTALDGLLDRYSITHVVAPNRRPWMECGRVNVIYEDANYAVYKILD
jgi:hypothetical protein